MKKLFTLLFGFSAATVMAQQIEIREPAGAIVNGTTITVNMSQGETEELHELWVINNSTGQKKINVKRYEMGVTANTKNYFCWFLCLNEVTAGNMPTLTHPTSTSQCPYMDAGDTVTSFSAHHKPQNNPGTSTYRYVFYDVNNTNDSSYVDIVFDVATGISNAEQNVELKLYPNPAKDQANLTYTFSTNQKRTIVLYDVLGQKVAEYTITSTSGNVTIDLSEMREGIYLCSIVENGKAIQTKRLIVSR